MTDELRTTAPSIPRIPTPPGLPAVMTPTAPVPAVAVAVATAGPSDEGTEPKASVHPVVQGIDRIGDIVGVIVFAHLALQHSIDGNFAAVCILTLLGVNTGLRQWGARLLQSRGATGAGLGVLGLVVGLMHPETSRLIASVSTVGS